jgi:acetoin utilization deacetylase AcuC-like enzyme
VFDAVIAPAARRFRPEMIFVSAGYDAHRLDPFALLQFRSSTYYKLAARVKALADELCEGRLLCLLEGGYNVAALGESVVETFLALTGQASRDVDPLPEEVELTREEPLAEAQAVAARPVAALGLAAA